MARELQLVLVDLQVVLDRRELLCRSCVARPCELERIRKLTQLPQHLLRLCALRTNRGVGERRDCRQKSDADPRKYVRRLSQPTNDNPL